MRFTKIVATIGPATESEEMIKKLIVAGVDVFRFNFKHNTLAWHSETIKRINRVADKLGKRIGTLIDLQGPEIRINMPFDDITLKIGEQIAFGPSVFEKKQKGFSLSHPEILTHLAHGQKISADDGMFSFTIEKKSDGLHLRSQSQGVLKNRKTLNIPGAQFPFPTLVQRDFDALATAAKSEVDFVALSFVRTAKDVVTLRHEIIKNKIKAKIVSKIETKQAIDNLDEIVDISDAIMVARGDMGVEIPIEQVPFYQKIIIKKCILKGVPVITATQMLQSMVVSPYPTRAEVSDVANACYDLTDAVMLSAETATGQYPTESVAIMNKTVSFNEKTNRVDSRVRFNFDLSDEEEIVADTAYGLYRSLMAKNRHIAGFLVVTQTGRSAQLLSRYRPLTPIYAFTPTVYIAEDLVLNFGVVSFLGHDFEKAYKKLLEEHKIKKEELLVCLLHKGKSSPVIRLLKV